MTEAVSSSSQVLDFLWLELTNQCNLNCLHCYSESSPRSTEKNLLEESDYLSLLTQAHALGCRRVQFIGGEPTLNKSLPALIGYADGIGFEFIEVFTNLVSLSDSLLDTFIRHRVAVATSVYASEPGLHDLITQAPGSHQKTIANIQRILNAGLPLRASIIAMEENKNAIDATTELLRGLGVTNIGRDRVRGFGRAQADSSCSMGDLCGNCANNILAIGPDGVAAPCIMSKHWSVGSVLDTPLRQIAMSDGLYETRRRIAEATAANYEPCQPDQSCMPNCSPSASCIPCAPNAGQPCEPNRWCNPAQR
jgi:sulfatase maturation enzyme AslB (radical SAM superfamily)